MSNEMEFELSDIFGEIKFKKDGTAINDEKVVEENIIEILKREKLWKKSYSICFPLGANAFIDVRSTDNDPSTYQYDYEIFSDPNTVVASGTCYGNLMVYRKSDDEMSEDYCKITSVEVIEMTLEVNKYTAGFAKKSTDKEVVNFD